MRRRFFYPLIALFFLFNPAMLQAASIQKVVLENGLTVVLWEEHKAPVVTFQMWYKVGSRNEITGKTGVSHVTEHMMFKGTSRHGKGEFSRIVAKNGGTENAFTGNDYTAYFENFAADRIDLSLELESDRMQHLLIDPEEFQLERAVVMEERRTRTDDDPYSYLIENLYAIAFLVHPYHSPVIGWMSDLENLVRNDVYAHYKKYYVPNNATLVIVGDFETDVLLPKLKAAFNGIPKGADVPQRVSKEPEQTGMRRSIVKREAQFPFVFIGYPAPNYQSPDTYALTVLSTLLSSGKSARLYRRLVYEDQVALETGGYYSGLTTDPEIFYVYAMASMAQKEKTTEVLEAALDAEIERIQSEGATAKELEKAKNQISAEYLLGSDSNFYRAMQVGTAETVGAGHEYVLNYIEHIGKVTLEDVQRVAQKYLIEDKKNVGILLPKTTPEAP